MPSTTSDWRIAYAWLSYFRAEKGGCRGANQLGVEPGRPGISNQFGHCSTAHKCIQLMSGGHPVYHRSRNDYLRTSPFQELKHGEYAIWLGLAWHAGIAADRA